MWPFCYPRVHYTRCSTSNIPNLLNPSQSCNKRTNHIHSPLALPIRSRPAANTPSHVHCPVYIAGLWHTLAYSVWLFSVVPSISIVVPSSWPLKTEGLGSSRVRMEYLRLCLFLGGGPTHK